MSLSLSRGKQLNVGHHGITQDDLPPMDQGTLDPRHWFNNTDNPPPTDSPTTPRPIELEIGSGKGTFLVQHAKLYPDTDFLGIEWAKAFWRYAADRARRLQFNNIRLLRCDADMFIRHYVPDNTFQQIHIYFPDPWPKKRHHKRRLIQADFLRQLHRVLVPAQTNPAPPSAPAPGPVPSAPAPGHSSAGGAGGSPVSPPVQIGEQVSASPRIHIATDHADYFDWMQEHAEKVTDLFGRQPFVSPKSAGEGEMVGTNFERKYRQQGRTFQGMILAKRP